MRERRYGIRSVYFRTGVKDVLTLLVNSKTHDKVVLHMTFEGAIGQVRSPMKPTRVALEIGCCRINQQSLLWRALLRYRSSCA